MTTLANLPFTFDFDVPQAWQTADLGGMLNDSQAGAYYYANANADPAYFKHLGIVYLRGNIRKYAGNTNAILSLTANQVLFTLPVGYRPAVGLTLPVVGWSVNGDRLTALGINTQGHVFMARGNDVQFLEFSGVVFRAEQ